MKEESFYTIIEELIRILIESGLLGELGETASESITQILTDTSQGISTVIALALEPAVPVLLIMNTYCLYLIYRSYMEKPGAVVLSIVSLFFVF